MPIIGDDVGNNVSRSTWFERHTSRNDESPNFVVHDRQRVSHQNQQRNMKW